MWNKMFKWIRNKFVFNNRKDKNGLDSDNPFLIL